MVKDPSKYFYVCDGSVLKSLADLKKALKNMPEDVYVYHSSRDDFAKWVEGVLRKKALAKKINGADRKNALKALKG